MNEKPIEAAGLNEQLSGQHDPQEPFPAPLLPGAQLAAKRLEQKLTIEEVANRLNLAPRQIFAMESDNYGALPGISITRGFIRSYAKLLNLESAPLLAMLPNEAGSHKEDASIRRVLPAKPFYDNRSRFASKRTIGSKPKIAVASLFILAMVLIGWKLEWIPVSFTQVLEKQWPLSASSEKKDDSPSEPLDASFPAQERGNEDGSLVGTAGTGQAQNNPDAAILGKTDGKPAKGKDEPITQETYKAAGLPVSAGTPSAGISGDRLVLVIREESWIEVRDAGRKVLVSRLARAGETESLAVSSPLDVKIGNAAGVDASLRGVPLELMSAAQGNVARLTVK